MLTVTLCTRSPSGAAARSTWVTFHNPGRAQDLRFGDGIRAKLQSMQDLSQDFMPQMRVWVVAGVRGHGSCLGVSVQGKGSGCEVRVRVRARGYGFGCG